MNLSDTTHLSFASAVPLPVFILLAAAALGFSIWSYLRTTPLVVGWLRGVLSALRALALCGGLVVLTRPVFTLNRTHHEPARIAILIDRSASMSLEAGNENRPAELEAFLASDEFKQLEDRCRLSLFVFADSLMGKMGSPDELGNYPPIATGSNLSCIDPAGWGDVLGRKNDAGEVQGVILVSDGVHNSGPDPTRLALSARQPVWTLGVGSPLQPRDAAVLGISVSPVVYRDSQVPVALSIRADRLQGEALKVSLTSPDGKVVGARRIAVEKEFQEFEVSFEVDVTEPGRQRFVASIDLVQGELTHSNNRRGFYLNVLESRIRVLMLSGSPDNSLGDLARRLKADNNIQLTQFTQRGSGFYEGQPPSDSLFLNYDVVILHKFPSRGLRGGYAQMLATAIEKFNLPLLYIDGRQVDVNALGSFNALLPVTLQSRMQRDDQAPVSPLLRHAVTADPEQSDYTYGWSKLPPLEYSPGRFQVKPGALELAGFNSASGNDPALVVAEAGRRKSAGILGRDIWRWGLVAPEEEGVYISLLRRLIRWLAVRKDFKNIAITFDRDIFSEFEAVGFSVSVQDENYRPVQNALVTAKALKDGQEGVAMTLEDAGGGSYRGRFQSWGEGEYQLRVEARLGDELLGTDAGKVSVEPFSVELLNTARNDQLLRAIADNSGGGFAPLDSADSLLNSIVLPAVEIANTTLLETAGRTWLLIAIIGALALEWFIRVRTGML